jgi:gamma-glutamyltranspeptidase/glutathione hydrolase
MEGGFSEETAQALAERGHQVIQGVSPVNQVGGGQAIFLDPSENVLLGASDRRKDGCAIGLETQSAKRMAHSVKKLVGLV